jgi:hypothetical protein
MMTLESLHEVEAALSAPFNDLASMITEDQRNAKRLHAFYRRANELVGEMEVDLDAPLSEDDE